MDYKIKEIVTDKGLIKDLVMNNYSKKVQSLIDKVFEVEVLELVQEEVPSELFDVARKSLDYAVASYLKDVPGLKQLFPFKFDLSINLSFCKNYYGFKFEDNIVYTHMDSTAGLVEYSSYKAYANKENLSSIVASYPTFKDKVVLLA